MLSCEPESDAALAEAVDVLAALWLADAADALETAEDAEPPEDEQPASRAPPASVAPKTPVAFSRSRLVYIPSCAVPVMRFPLFPLGRAEFARHKIILKRIMLEQCQIIH